MFLFMYVCILYVCKCAMYINGSRVMMVKIGKFQKREYAIHASQFAFKSKK